MVLSCCHGTDLVLAKVVGDLLLASDCEYFPALPLLDCWWSAAFGTYDKVRKHTQF